MSKSASDEAFAKIEEQAAKAQKQSASTKAKGVNQPEYEGEQDLIDAAGDFLLTNKKSNVDSKMKKMQKLGLTQAESAAIATWIGTEVYTIPGIGAETRYSLMNQAIYAKGTLPPDLQAKIEATNQLAINGYNKIPAITPDVVSEQAQKKLADFDPDAPLQRHMMIPGNPAAFVQKYKDALAGNGEIAEETHFATTHKQNLGWVATGANITYRVTPKWDGTGRGRYIDNFKNQMSEGEIMFIPGTKFRVKAVLDPNTSKKPVPPKDYVDDAIILKIQTAQFASTLGAGSWQKNFKSSHGKAAYDALPATLKKAKSQKVIDDFFSEQAVTSASYKAKLDEYNKKGSPDRYIIELEEI